MSDDDETAIWVASDLAADQQRYMVTVHYSDDQSHAMSADETVEYASTVLRAAGAAAYDAAVYAQLTRTVDLPMREAASMISLLRQRREQDRWRAGPLVLTTGLSSGTGQPFLDCGVASLRWQWTPQDAEQHVRYALEVAGVVEYDTQYRQLLLECGADPHAARAIVASLIHYRE